MTDFEHFEPAVVVLLEGAMKGNQLLISLQPDTEVQVILLYLMSDSVCLGA